MDGSKVHVNNAHPLCTDGAARFGASLFQEVRNVIFAKVAQSTIRTISTRVFSHILHLDLSWHMSRQTGGLSRAIDRGTK